jgi:sterol desaturase/sphingolipid hydroxylase (fatty acid hydroxylase superfamily)
MDQTIALLPVLLEPLEAFVTPSKRVFWAYLVGAALLASVVWLRRLRHRCSLRAFLFPPAIWLHRSTGLDVQILFARAALQATILAPLTLSTVAVSVSVSAGLRAWVPVAVGVGLDRALVLGLFTVSAFLADDFSRYVVHRLSHRVPALWELHQVHHSAEVLTPLTVYRTHPIESLLIRAGASASVGLVAGVFLWACPGRLSGWEILGVDALGFVWNILGSNLRHSHVWISYGRQLEHLLISPAQHQIHHSRLAHHHDRNFGTVLAVWDWVFGSLYVAHGRERLAFGLAPEVRNHTDRLDSMLVAPALAAARRLVPGRRRRKPAPGPAKTRVRG